MTAYDKLRALSISLPEVPPPIAAFVPFVRSGNLLFLSGHIAKKNGKPWNGQLGANVTTDQGKEDSANVARTREVRSASRRFRSARASKLN